MMNNRFALGMNRDGELVQDHLHDFTKAKYKPDSPFLWGPIPYLLMIGCTIIDLAFFRSLFVRISYDSPAMIVLEVLGLAFAADVVSAYAGVLAKKISQGLSRDKLNLALLLAVPIVALIINGVLRYTTMSLSSADGTVNAEGIALCIISVFTPVFTSIGNFAISFQAYDPLAQKKCREEMALDEIRDYCRRLEAIKEECDDFNDAELRENDRQHLLNAKKALINDALILDADVIQQQMEYSKDPTSTNVLSKSRYERIVDRLGLETRALADTVEGRTVVMISDIV